jgi:hypothetical protein
MTLRGAILITLVAAAAVALMPLRAGAATEQEKQNAINTGLAHLAATQYVSGIQGYWPYNNDGTLAATASAALAFIEKGYLPGNDVVIGATNYGDVVGKACNYIFARSTADAQGRYFNPGNYSRSVYTTGIVLPVVHSLGQALGPDTQIGMGAPPTMTYRQMMQANMDWFGWGQSPDGGWRYYPNYGASDNSTAQWGSLAILYAQSWGCAVRDPTNAGWDVKANLSNWINTVQHGQDGSWMAGGSGYMGKTDYVNMSKTGGLLLELAATGAGLGDTRVQNALKFLQSTVGFDHWNAGPNGWDGNINQPYAMWAIYKALDTYGFLDPYGAPPNDFLIGSGIATAPGGIQIGQDWDPKTSLAGDWYSQYCDWLVDHQVSGSWAGYGEWTGALAEGWYINILNAKGAPPPVIPEPVTMIGMLAGIGGLVGYVRRRRLA